MRAIGMFRRLSNSPFLHWRSRRKQPRHKTTTGFFGAMNAEHHRHAIRCLPARQPASEALHELAVFDWINPEPRLDTRRFMAILGVPVFPPEGSRIDL